MFNIFILRARTCDCKQVWLYLSVVVTPSSRLALGILVAVYIFCIPSFLFVFILCFILWCPVSRSSVVSFWPVLLPADAVAFPYFAYFGAVEHTDPAKLSHLYGTFLRFQNMFILTNFYKCFSFPISQLGFTF